VQNTLKKSEILRGYSVFSDILKSGELIQGRGLRCYFRMVPPDRIDAGVVAGFAVPRKEVPLAVDRNRLKRLMREAYRLNKSAINDTMRAREAGLQIVLLFRKKKDQNVRLIRFTEVESSMIELLDQLNSQVRGSA